MNAKQKLQYLRDSAWDILHRKMNPPYDHKPDNWNRLRLAGIMRHLDRLHYSEWPDDLKECVSDIVYPMGKI